MGRVEILSHHFDRVAPHYAHVRNTDPDVTEPIINHLPGHNRSVDVVDVGCGTGRYTHIIAKRLGRRLRFFCCDCSGGMLVECRKRLSREFPSMHIDYCRASAENLPFASKSFDGIITFNAVHHFNLDRFVISASGVLRHGGLLSIYTRTPEQNGRTVWGQYFPGFAERETRLYPLERLEEVVGRTSGFHMEGIHEFKNVRAESVESLLNRAQNFHYSTFALYPRQEFLRGVETFAQRLNKISRNGLVQHSAENTLVLARRD